LKFRQKKTGNVEHMHLSEQALSFIGTVAAHDRVFNLPAYSSGVRNYSIFAKMRSASSNMAQVRNAD
jgi:hypothetical protein